MIENVVHVPKNEYEELVRDQHKIELLTNYFQKEHWMDLTVYLILGIEEPTKEKNVAQGAEELLGPMIAITPERDMSDTTTPQGLASAPLRDSKTSKKKIDHGKVLALHKAGWTGRKIAEEMQCSEALISMILKEARES